MSILCQNIRLYVTWLHSKNESRNSLSFPDNCSIVEATPSTDLHSKHHIQIHTYWENQTRYDCQFWYGLSGHIDVHSDKKRFNFVSYLGTPFFEKP